MADPLDYALLAGAAYVSTRDPVNQIPVPRVWSLVDDEEYPTSGFEAVAYTNGNEVVISFAGTNPPSAVDWITNATLGAGYAAQQLQEAVLFYARVKQRVDHDRITFTGHSLGGGLAALMGVFFNREAVTFDPAPFRAAASETNAQTLRHILQFNGFPPDAGLNSFRTGLSFTIPFLPGFISVPITIRGEEKITAIAVQGEALTGQSAFDNRNRLRIYGDNLILLEHGSATLTQAINLHAQELMVAFIASPQLMEISYKLPDLIPAIFDGDLFASPPGKDKPDLLNHLVRHHFGAESVERSYTLDRFASDFMKLADLNPSSSDETLVRILTEIGLQHYYQQNTTQEYVFQALGGGIQFDLTKPLGDTDTSLSQILGYAKLLTWARQQIIFDLAGGFEETPPVSALNELVGEKHRWSVGVGNIGLNGRGEGDVADIVIGGRNNELFDAGGGDDFLYGGSGADILMGGGGDDKIYGGSGEDRLDGGDDADKLYGGAGRDVLQGGEGDDRLVGGASAADYMVGGTGSDTYIYKSEDQADLIYDEDGQGHIEYDGATLSGGRGRGKNSRVFFDNPDNPDYTYSVSGDLSAGPVTLTIKRNKDSRGQLTVFDFYDGDLGIHLKDGDEDKAPRYKRPPPPPQDPGRQNRGDPLVIDLTGTGISTYGLEQNLHFDHDQDRFAEKTGWIAAGSGVLVLDANADATLDNGQELFGDFTRLPGGQLAANGFAALSQYDRNRDGRIDASDPIWSSLKVAVWETDPRGNTVLGDPATAMSLKTLEELGIASIGLDSSIATVTDENGNTRTRSGTVTLADGTTRELAEYRFARDTAETTFLDWRDLPAEIAVLPELTLGGVQMDLTQALVRDAQEGWKGQPPGSLRTKLDAFMNETDATALHARFEDLLFAWTGADALPAGTMTNRLDARHAQVLEKAYGRSFQNPNADQATAWQNRKTDTAMLRLLEKVSL